VRLEDLQGTLQRLVAGQIGGKVLVAPN